MTKTKKPTMTRKEINSERLRISEDIDANRLQRRRLDDEMMALQRLCPHSKTNNTADDLTCLDCGADLN